MTKQLVTVTDETIVDITKTQDELDMIKCYLNETSKNKFYYSFLNYFENNLKLNNTLHINKDYIALTNAGFYTNKNESIKELIKSNNEMVATFQQGVINQTPNLKF